MKPGVSIISVLLLGMSALLVGCGSGGNSSLSISGSVTVVNEADWANLQLGVFYDSTGISFSTDYDFGETDYVYRAVYSNFDDGFVYQFTPDPACSTTISQTSGLSGTFRVDFDPNGSTTGWYYVVAWIDSINNDQLDLVDSWLPDDQIASSELSRTPNYDDGGAYVARFYNDPDFGYTFDAHNLWLQPLSEVDTTSFSIDMTPVTGGW